MKNVRQPYFQDLFLERSNNNNLSLDQSIDLSGHETKAKRSGTYGRNNAIWSSYMITQWDRRCTNKRIKWILLYTCQNKCESQSRGVRKSLSVTICKKKHCLRAILKSFVYRLMAKVIDFMCLFRNSFFKVSFFACCSCVKQFL